METKKKINVLKISFIFSVVALLFFSSCDVNEIASKAIILSVNTKDVKINTAVLIVEINPNFGKTSIVYEYKPVLEKNWQTKAFAKELSGKDTKIVEIELTNLNPNTEYLSKIKAINESGETISQVSSFTTYDVSDFDGNLYHTIYLNGQVWLKENFRGTHFANGDPIENVTGKDTWRQLTTGAYCWYDNDVKNGLIYGGLYNFYVVSDSRGLISGWRAPTTDEWKKLILSLGGSIQAAIEMMEAGKTHWINPEARATNSSGFTALPNGQRGMHTQDSFVFFKLGENAMWWHSTSNGDGIGAATIYEENYVINYSYDKRYGFGIRLVKN